MRRASTLVIGVALGLSLTPLRLGAQACKDEEGMVDTYKKDLADLVGTVKKESLIDFERAYHQKSCLTKLTLYSAMVDGFLTCLDKAAQDTTIPKEEAEALKAKRATYAKLKETIQKDRTALKAAEAPKDAKDLIAKFELVN